MTTEPSRGEPTPGSVARARVAVCTCAVIDGPHRNDCDRLTMGIARCLDAALIEERARCSALIDEWLAQRLELSEMRERVGNGTQP